MKFKFLFVLCAVTPFLAHPASATIIQILHTNDLHASLETSGAPKDGTPEYGGWAQVKTVMDRLTDEAQQKGIETLRLDAGDFSEGTSFYFPDHGQDVLRAFQHMGYDATALGNHDWLMGARSLNQSLGEMPFSFPILSANLKINSALKNLKKQIIPSAQFVRGGVHIGVFGLSTDEALYKWITRIDSKKKDLQIVNFRDDSKPGIANRMIRKLRKRDDLVIALTHIGYDEDQLLAKNSRGLDLIVGGHSHTVLESMNLTPDRDGHTVPIVQTGFNGKYVGRILVDVEPGKRPQVLTYELVPVPHDTPQDPVIAQDVALAKERVEALYLPAKLDEVIGQSKVRLVSGENGPTAYSKFAVDAMKDVTDAQIGLDVGAFHGGTAQAAGDVTRLKLMEMYPRKFEVAQNEGLYVYEARIPGWVLALGLKYAVKFGAFLSFSGLTFDVYQVSNSQWKHDQKEYRDSIKQFSVTPYRVRNIQVDGAPICRFCSYTVAAPESLIRGAWGITSLTKLIIRDGHPTPHTIWDAMTFHLYRIKTIEPISENDHFNSREFSNGYRRAHSKGIDPEGYDPLEGADAPWSHDHGSASAIVTDFFNDVQKHILNPKLIEQDEKDEQ